MGRWVPLTRPRGAAALSHRGKGENPSHTTFHYRTPQQEAGRNACPTLN